MLKRPLTRTTGIALSCGTPMTTIVVILVITVVIFSFVPMTPIATIVVTNVLVMLAKYFHGIRTTCGAVG